MLQATNNWMRQSTVAISAWIPNNMGTKDAAGRVIADFGQGLPAGTTYAISFPNATGHQVLYCGTSSRTDCFDIDSNGVLRVAAGKTLDSVNAGIFRGKSIGAGYNWEQQMIDKLAGHSPNGYWQRENYANTISVAITPPNEPTTNSSINLKPVRTEAQENVVMKFSETLVKTGTFPGDSPFKRGHHNYFKRMATGESVQINASQYGHGDSITESVLASHQLEGNTKLASATTMVGGGRAYYGQSNGAKTYYRTNTVANGLNENDTNILDFEYWFPVDNAHNGHSVTGTAKTKGIYAPLAVANADWNNQMPSTEHARYGCYDSGQGCGSGTHELSISGSMVQSTESSGASFSGYKVTQRNFSDITDNLLNATANGSTVADGTGTQTLLGSYNNGFGSTNGSLTSEFETVTLPETFDYFGQSFTHIYVNENGFLTFGNSGDNTHKPWHQLQLNGGGTSSNVHPKDGGGRPIQYLHEANAYAGGNSSYEPDNYHFPDVYGKPGTGNEDNLDNTIFALWNDYNTDSPNVDWSIRQLWNSATKILTIGWYNVRSFPSSNAKYEANFEVQLNFNDDSFRIVHGDFGTKFPSDGSNNAFVGISKDVSCATSTNDISMCEGKDYIQLRFHDNDFGRWETPSMSSSTFQNKQGSSASGIDHLYNSYFSNNQTVNGTEYCYNSTTNFSDTSCANTYNFGIAAGGSHYIFDPQGGGGSTKNVLLPSDIKQSYSLGTQAEFMWMELRKPSTTLTYTPPENNATGFTQGGANKNASVTTGTLQAGSAVSTTTYANEVVIAGEVYKDEQMDAFLNGTKKVLAFAPIPIIHTNKYRMTQQPTGATDVRFKHAHTIMPHFISEAFMEDKDNGTDLRFDFHQLVDQDYAASGYHMVYGTSGGNSFTTQNQYANSMLELNLDGMYAYTADVLAQDGKLATTRFNNGNASDYHTPIGQSLWQQVFNPNGRGAGIFVQMNWSCGDGGSVRCNQPNNAKDAGPHKTQQSLFSVLIAEVGSKTFFQDQTQILQELESYDGYAQGHVMRGEHYWSYKRRSGRTTTTDGAYATTDASPQLSFGQNPINCHSGVDNGCFFGDGQSPDSATNGAPQAAVVTTSDSCKHGVIPGNGCNSYHNPGVMHSMAETTDPTDPEWKVGSFNQGIVLQKQRDANNNLVEAINLEGASNSWRAGQTTTSDTWTGSMIGLLMTDVNDTSKNAIPRSFNVNSLQVFFDDRNDRVKFLGQNINIEKDLGNECETNAFFACSAARGVNHWYHALGGQSGRSAGLNFNNISNTNPIQFGDADDTVDQPYDSGKYDLAQPWTESAYLNKKVFGAILKNGIAFTAGSSCENVNDCSAGADSVNVAGAIVTWDTIEKKDRDFMTDATTEPSLEYMSWGIWAMANSDIERRSGTTKEAAAVHMGTWYAGDLLDASDWPVARTASLAGMAMFDVFARIEESGVTNSYHWTEGAAATGSVQFHSNGSYDVAITVDNLGSEYCPSSYCGSTFDQNMNKGPMGSITWNASQSATTKNPHFSTAQSSTVAGGFSRVTERDTSAVAGGHTVITYKNMSGSLYGTANHVEVGAQLEFTRQNINEMIMLRGTAILSE